MKIINVLIV